MPCGTLCSATQTGLKSITEKEGNYKFSERVFRPRFIYPKGLRSSRHSPTNHPHRQVCAPTDSDTPVFGRTSAHSAVYRSPFSLPRLSRQERLNLSPHPWKAKIYNLSLRNRTLTVPGISVETLGTSGRYYVLPPSDAVLSLNRFRKRIYVRRLICRQPRDSTSSYCIDKPSANDRMRNCLLNFRNRYFQTQRHNFVLPVPIVFLNL